MSGMFNDPGSSKTKQKRSGDVGAILSSLFNRILDDNNITASRYAGLVRTYLRLVYKDDPVRVAQATNNIIKELKSPGKTWKSFCRDLQCLRVMRFEISIKLTFFGGKTSVHSRLVDLSDQIDVNEGVDDAQVPD